MASDDQRFLQAGATVRVVHEISGHTQNVEGTLLGTHALGVMVMIDTHEVVFIPWLKVYKIVETPPE